MSLIKTIGLYLIGFSLGLVFLAFFFKEKRTEFCYLPNCRVLKEIRSKELTFTPEIQLLIDNNTITLEDFKILFLEGDIDFSRSNTNAKPCKNYLVNGKIKGNPVEVALKNCANKIVVEKVNTP